MNILKRFLGEKLFWKLKFIKEKIIQTLVRFFNLIGINIFPSRNYYSPLPVIKEVKKHESRWNKASALKGLKVDLDANESFFKELLNNYLEEYQQIIDYKQAQTKGFGPGYTYVDSITTYAIIRKINPRKYLEVGSGLSTFYAEKALNTNATGATITCIEPYPYEALKKLKGIELIEDEVQNVDFEKFEALEAGDILFIDSTHIVKIDGDVPFLILEVLPRLKKGVYIHIHDIHFPYNTPYPADFWVLKRGFPMYWTEAMLVQAFLAFNSDFEIILSTPIIRHFNEDLLKTSIPEYEGVDKMPNTFSSLWLKKIN